ncbi:MAG TPA: hypothetical protein VIL27_02860, partial [Clostridia bacterium]
ENGTVTDHMMYSDMLDPDFPSLLSGICKGCRFDPAELAQALGALRFDGGDDSPYGVSRSAIVRDIQQLVTDQLV